MMLVHMRHFVSLYPALIFFCKTVGAADENVMQEWKWMNVTVTEQEFVLPWSFHFIYPDEAEQAEKFYNK